MAAPAASRKKETTTAESDSDGDAPVRGGVLTKAERRRLRRLLRDADSSLEEEEETPARTTRERDHRRRRRERERGRGRGRDPVVVREVVRPVEPYDTAVSIVRCATNCGVSACAYGISFTVVFIFAVLLGAVVLR